MTEDSQTQENTGLFPHFAQVEIGKDGVLQIHETPKDWQYAFECNGITYQAAFIPTNNKFLFEVWGVIGELPFSAQNPDLRNNLIRILKASHQITPVRFVVDRSGKIIATMSKMLDSNCNAVDLLYSMVCYIYQSQPFSKLIIESSRSA